MTHENRINRFTLEISAKPFYPLDPEETAAKLRDLFGMWYSILKHAEEPALLWWFGDGAEILEFTGDDEQSVEWAKWLGFAQQNFNILRDHDPEQKALWGADWLYREDAGSFTIAQMRKFVELAREAAHQVLGKRLSMGLAFDPGNEFSKSEFRYEWHPEILLSDGKKAIICIDATSRLHGDDHPYAAFPNGVPEGTPFGTFFGAQTREFLQHVNFDFLWFSNSFGFGRSPYAFGATGEFFDGEEFTLEKNHEVRDAVVEFWQLFREQCPEPRIACRGTDFTAGFNLISQATPYRRLYGEIDNILPPPNTPWPALTKNRGLAWAGFLSQISAWPHADFPYRFYLSDPWWLNSPWMDRYENNPSDIYLTCGLSRLTGNGRLDVVSEMALLSVDTSWGELPEEFADTLIPHLKQGLTDRPDAPGPFIWVYPFDAFDQAVFDDKTGCERILCNDANILQALNRGLPLSTVITPEALTQIQEENPEKLRGCVLISLVPSAGSAWERALARHWEQGDHVLCYGNTRHASPEFRDKLGLGQAEELLSELSLDWVAGDKATSVMTSDFARQIFENAILNDGGVSEIAEQATCLAQAKNSAGESRALATVHRQETSALTGWTRGLSSINGFNRPMGAVDSTEYFPCEILFREILAAMGWSIRFDLETPELLNYYCQIHRSRNAYVLSATAQKPAAALRVRTPFGAPLLPKTVNRIENGHTLLDLRAHRWFHAPCRVFVEGQDGLITNTMGQGTHHPFYRHGWFIEDLENATLRVFPVSGCINRTQILLNPNRHNTLGEAFEGGWEEQHGFRFLTLRNITGRVSFVWSQDDTPLPKAVSDLRVDD